MRSRLVLLLLLALVPVFAEAQVDDALRARAAQEERPFLDTLRDLVAIESGSGDVDGIARIGALVASRLRDLGGAVEMVPPAADMRRFINTPPALGQTVVARFRGRGTRRILLLAHMDTVYQRGMLAEQPFRVDGDRAFGLGIADDKHGVALILHTLAVLKALHVESYGLITVLISPDEEIGANAERDLITRLGSEHDIVLSCEGSGQEDILRVATTGAEIAVLNVTGRASHAGTAPEQGRNALYEMSHQILQMRDLSDQAKGVRLNWTLAAAGSASNAIPAEARAVGDMRANDERDFGALEAAIRERITRQLIPETTVAVTFERIYPSMPPREGSVKAAEHARGVYAEIGGTLRVDPVANGGGTLASFAALNTTAPVIEGMGLRNYGSHSNNAEYINISSIAPRLYLLARMVIDAAAGKVAGMQ